MTLKPEAPTGVEPVYQVSQTRGLWRTPELDLLEVRAPQPQYRVNVVEWFEANPYTSPA